jgi:hypothetical protein
VPYQPRLARNQFQVRISGRVGPGNFTPTSHGTGLKPLSLSGSCHPPEDCRLPPKSSSSGCPLTRFSSGDLPPSLHRHCPVSPLLRSSPPLAGASVLSASRGFRLHLFPYHRQPGSQVPYRSPDWVHATSIPDIAWSVSRLLPCCSQISRTLWFRCRLCIFDKSPVVHLRSSPQSPHDVILSHAF